MEDGTKQHDVGVSPELAVLKARAEAILADDSGGKVDTLTLLPRAFQLVADLRERGIKPEELGLSPEQAARLQELNIGFRALE